MIEFLKEESLVIQLWARQQAPSGQQLTIQKSSSKDLKSSKKADDNKSLNKKNMNSDAKKNVSIFY